MNKCKIPNWKERSKNRAACKKLIREVKAHSGFYCHQGRGKRRGRRRRFITVFTRACHLSPFGARIKTNTIPSYIFKILFNIILPPTTSFPCGLSFRVLNLNLEHISLLSHTCHMPCTSFPQFHHPNIM